VWGSDAVAAMLRALDVPYIALNPGASFRGLHDSLVNYLGNERPQLLLCLHEESAVAIAHGYAKAAFQKDIEIEPEDGNKRAVDNKEKDSKYCTF
jgi:thiamine pyrophosphate-dependent acetolactate synthase large subunit-like protein